MISFFWDEDPRKKLVDCPIHGQVLLLVNVYRKLYSVQVNLFFFDTKIYIYRKMQQPTSILFNYCFPLIFFFDICKTFGVTWENGFDIVTFSYFKFN